jgi:uncharacterized protein YigE (DUF2233 family)
MMARRRFAAALSLALLAGGSPAGSARAEDPESPICRPVSHEGAGYVVCTIDLRREALNLFWRGPDGHPYASLSRLAEVQGPKLLVAVNAGMYDPELAPVGLYVENGRELKSANTKDGDGNFHLKPNGVFYLGRGSAGVLETGEYLRRGLKPEFATQSGPMLVIHGQIHPKISEDGPSKKLRNGVGIRDSSTVLLAISDGPVSFGAFARLFRDGLGCPDALFLDGSISALYAPEIGRRDVALKPLGPMIGVTERPTGAKVPHRPRR